MTVKAVRDLTMFLVAHDAVDLAVLARRAPPLVVNISMATAAGLHVDIAGKADLQRRVNPHMTG